jgi:hypothetical protein
MDRVKINGPYESFADAAAAVGLYTATDATTSIWIHPQFEGSRPT